MHRLPGRAAFQLHNDHALHAAFGGEGIAVAQRLDALGAVEESLAQSIDQSHVGGAALRGYATQCYMPSLERVAMGQRHTHEVAQAVSKNLQTLAIAIAESRTLGNLDSTTKSNLSEIAVLSVLWWGISYGHVHEGSYAVFTTRAQDASTSRVWYNGVDIIMKQAGSSSSRKHRIQVKSTPSQKNTLKYEPGIAVITPYDLVGTSTPLRTLFYGLASNDLGLLSNSYSRAEHHLERARRRKIAHKAFQGYDASWIKAG